MYQRPTSFKMLPDVIKNLLIINGLFFLATVVLGNVAGFDLVQTLGLYLPGSPHFQPYQVITHIFMHGNLTHIFFNMFALWMFGYTLENVWGSKRFLIYYMITGLGAAVIHLGVNYWEAMALQQELVNAGFTPQMLSDLISSGRWDGGAISGVSQDVIQQYYYKYNVPTVGASGAVFGVLLAFGMMFPNQYVYLYFAIPIKVKYFVAGYAALELYSGIANDPSSNIAHFAHLGGMLFGFILIKYWKKRGELY
ncbi:putative membrane protein [Owenweeksia hongkongensis DSM 17368]|uniref:Putative membrane protein n=1 Tax=Owenweeksia hongkongensis (strain DSM 17368 / CIP 108786 / JCM 12287 / NRRL B-23963 / UST20020801) TaxID=926562 RepID=G8R598_OWEHD|nr:rhomboid family intramembrane serine protease [Owenweeksia hongkongensis]AEV32143.1 putative membrane protein [Owenweeksia hongkongensis DSM 17368]